MPDGFSAFNFLQTFTENFFMPSWWLDLRFVAFNDILPKNLKYFPFLIGIQCLDRQVDWGIGGDDHGGRIGVRLDLAILADYSLAAVTVITSSRVVMPSDTLRKP